MGSTADQQTRRHQQDLKKLRAYLSQRPRDLLLFEFLLLGDITTRQILELKFGDLADCLENHPLPIPRETGNSSPLLTPSIKHAYDLVRRYGGLGNDDFLFKSRKGDKQLSVTSVSRLVRNWLKKVNLREYKSLHDMRVKFNSNNSEGLERNLKTSDLGALPPVKNFSVQENAYKELSKSILNGTIPPGKKILPDRIARRMVISTTPVREALRRLEVKGFVVHHPQKGWVVSKLSRDDLKEILDMRLLLECEAIYRAATNIKPETMRKLKIAQQDYEQADAENNPSGSLKANRRFHMLAYQDAGSSMMSKIINELWDLVSPYYQILFSQSLLPKPSAGLHNHVEIVHYLQNKNPDQVRFWLKEDIVKPAEFVLNLFDLYEKSFQ